MTTTRERRRGFLSGRGAGAGALSTAGQSAMSKLLVMAVSGVVSVMTTKLVISHFGVEAYAQYGLLVSVAALLPFADLGLAAVVINAVSTADDPDSDERVRRTLVSALRVVLSSAAVIIGLALLLTVAGAWPALLGSGLQPGSGPAAALLCMVVFACTLPLAIGQRVLTAVGLNHVQVLTGGLAAPLFASGVVVAVVTGAPAGGYLAVLSYLTGTAVAVVGTLIAARRLPTTSRQVLVDLPRVRTVPGVPVMQTAWPMLVQMIALPIAMQTDRLLISHLSSTQVLAEYNLAFSLFAILLQTTNAAGVALWPVFARARKSGLVTSPAPLVGAFAGAAALMAAALALAIPLIAPFLSDGKIAIGTWTTWTFAAFVVVQAAKYPLGMYMTDVRGLRFQMIPVLVMVPVNLGFSWWLVGPLGAAGPVLASTGSVVLCQLAPYWWYVRKDLAVRRAAAA